MGPINRVKKDASKKWVGVKEVSNQVVEDFSDSQVLSKILE